jgi:hypothetical protein
MRGKTYTKGRKVKKSFESTYPRPEGVALRPIHGFATAISEENLQAEPVYSDH